MSEYKKLTLNGADFPKYESPIQVLFDDDCQNPIITEFEDAIVAQVSQTLHIKIDKGELEKALAYDRGQYEKGYKDALGEQPTVDAVPVRHGYNKQFEFPSQFTCSVCGWESWDTYCCDTDTFNYCPNCGAKMDGVDGERRSE